MLPMRPGLAQDCKLQQVSAAVSPLAAIRYSSRGSLNEPMRCTCRKSAGGDETEKRQLFTDYVSAAGTRENAMNIVTNVTPEQRKLVQDILARVR